MIRFIFIALFSLPILVFGQSPKYASYDWNTIPVTHPSDTIKSVDGAVVMLERRINEVYINADQYFEEIYVYHKKIKVENHDAVDTYNKIYISLNNVIEILNVKARFIAPDGKITELPKESIHEVENLEDKGNYQSFAIEGAEVGGQVEYFYVLCKKFDANNGIFIQNDEVKSNVYVQFTYPVKLEYLFKSYNGFPDFNTYQDTSENTVSKVADMGYIPSLKEEQYSFYKANLMRYEFTLSFNRYNSSNRVYSFAKLSDNLYDVFYSPSKAEVKAVKKLLKSIDQPTLPLDKRIRHMENEIKTSMAIDKEGSYDISLDQAIKFHQIDKRGSARLFVTLFQTAGIDYRIGLTCNREERYFDPDFNAWNYLDEYFIYLPQLNQIIVPFDENFRLGVAPSEFQNNYSLLLRPIQYDKKTSFLGYDLYKLPYESCWKNADSMLINLAVNPDDLTLHVNENRTFSGSNACNIQGFWTMVPDEKKNELINSIFNMGADDATINKYDVQNGTPSDMGNTSMYWQVDMTVKSLVEVAGNDLIVKVGETIGEQSQLYNDKERISPVQIDQLRSYYRQITLTIPDGYSTADLESLNMNVQMLNDEKITCQFKSWYQMEGNKLTIYSREYYSEPYYPKDRFEDYRKVINAAADFNKKTVLLVKQE